MSASTTPTSADVLEESSTDGLDDAALVAWLTSHERAKRSVVYVHAEFLCAVYALDADEAELLRADPRTKARTVLKRIGKKNLLSEVALDTGSLTPARAPDPDWSPTPITSVRIDELVSERIDSISGQGRGKSLSTAGVQKVWADAGARCMFEGCAADLSSVNLLNKTARVGYLAHIVASDPRGPRGDANRSHELSDNPENIMLMCDAHHRTIDSFAPELFPTARLNQMRRNHVERVRLALESLKFPTVEVGTVFGDLANIPTQFLDSEFNDALLMIGRAMIPGAVTHYIRRTQRDDRQRPGFWLNYLREHEQEIRQFVANFKHREPTAHGKREIAFFPLHHVPTLVLAGRVVGEAHTVHLFQYHREKQTWCWDPNVEAQAELFFSIEGLSESPADSVLISLEVSSPLDERALPDQLNSALASKTPWIRIRAANPSGSCIRHPQDLEMFTAAARKVINHVQDIMRADKVNLIGLSPASTLFRFGQMLQAGHHPPYTIYDRADHQSSFVPALTITGNQVSAESGEDPFSIALR